MSKKMEPAQSYWDARSELFANYYIKPSLFDRMFRSGVYGRVAEAIKCCRDIPGATVLDAGSGPGINSVSLIKNAGASHVTGIDFSQQMVDFAEKVAKSEDVDVKTKFILGDVLTHDFAGRLFDFSMALGVLDYIEDSQQFISRISALTKNAFVVSWPENGIRMRLRRHRYTCPLFHYDLEQIQKIHAMSGISAANLRVTKIAGGWVTTAKKL